MIDGKPRLYRRHEVWRQISDTIAARYVCFELLGDRSFAVQSCDFFRLPVSEQAIQRLDRQAIELFMEDDPIRRSGAHLSLAAAIEAHDQDFAGL
jgi:hypothetical protein